MNGEEIPGTGVSPRARAYGPGCLYTRATPHGIRGSAPANAGTLRVTESQLPRGRSGLLWD